MAGQPPPGGLQSLPETKKRFFSEEFADIAKLREIGGKHAHKAMKLRHRAAKYLTSMESYRYKATVAKEKSEMMAEKILEVQAMQKELESELQVGARGVQGGAVMPREQSRLHVKIRKCTEKVVKYQRKAAYYLSKNAHYLAVSSQKKARADQLEEQAKVFDIEAQNYSTRADRLQMSTSDDATASHQAHMQIGRQ